MPRPAAEPPLSDTSLEWLAGSDAIERKRHGQYLTPRPVAEALLDRVRLRPGMRVLDPGVGTGELLAAVVRREPDADLTGWDVDPDALAAARRLVPGAKLVRRSALDPCDAGRHDAEDSAACGRYDLVIANPPYFQVRVTPELKLRFAEVISGRANAFALFFKAGLDLLEPGGTLAFIVPPSMNSGAYFEALREHIVSRAIITDLTVLEGSTLFEGANTAAQLLVLEKDGGPPGDFVFERAEPEAGFRRVVFTESPGRLRTGFEGRTTLWQLGFEAVTGTVVWNQRRGDLRRRPRAGTVPLIWSRELRGGTFDPGRRSVPSGPGTHEGRPGFICSERSVKGPALLVNRVVGAVGRGQLRCAFVPEGTEFLAENHVNVIRARKEQDTSERLRTDWAGLQAALEAPGTGDRARLLTGNTQISATELTHLLPV